MRTQDRTGCSRSNTSGLYFYRIPLKIQITEIKKKKSRSPKSPNSPGATQAPQVTHVTGGAGVAPGNEARNEARTHLKSKGHIVHVPEFWYLSLNRRFVCREMQSGDHRSARTINKGVVISFYETSRISQSRHSENNISNRPQSLSTTKKSHNQAFTNCKFSSWGKLRRRLSHSRPITPLPWLILRRMGKYPCGTCL
jgi:hypothetical protein